MGMLSIRIMGWISRPEDGRIPVIDDERLVS